MPKYSLEDKVVLVTGASRGIGEATARAFATAGAKLVLGARDEAALEQLASRIGALPVPLDVTRETDCDRFVETALKAYGGIDVLVNNAGVGLWGPVSKLTPQELAQVMDVNVYGALRLVSRVVPHLKARGGGRIVNVSSVLGHVSVPMSGGYAATKSALNALTDALRLELESDRISVSLVCPGQTATAFRRSTVRASRSPVDRPDRESASGASPESVAQAILEAVRTGRREIDLTLVARAAVALHRLAPALYDRLAGRAFRDLLAAARAAENRT